MNPSHSVLLGTPLIKQKSQDHKKKNIHTQEVVDDQGRVRLHGAFQGGFSAGYYMSVGSKEGILFSF
jgi:G patch domain-containing protein 1